MTPVEIRHFHLFCGLGGGAKGFNKAHPRVGNLQAKFRCIGGVDVDPAGIRDVAEIAGPAADLLKRGFQGAGQVLSGKPVEGAMLMAPTAVRNLEKAFDMAQTGMYRDQRGHKVIDVDGYDALVKAIGFQPTAVAKVQDAVATQQDIIAQNKMMETELADAMANAIFEKDADAQQGVRDWNRNNPASPVTIDMVGVRRRLVAMRASKAKRVERSAPKAIRQDVRQALAEGSV